MAESERGQTTLLLAGVVAVALLLGVGVALVGDAVVHRMRARAAADAVAVAASVDSAAGNDMTPTAGRRRHDPGQLLSKRRLHRHHRLPWWPFWLGPPSFLESKNCMAQRSKGSSLSSPLRQLTR